MLSSAISSSAASRRRPPPPPPPPEASEGATRQYDRNSGDVGGAEESEENGGVGEDATYLRYEKGRC